MKKLQNIIQSFLAFVEDAQMRRAERVLACYRKNGTLGTWE